MMTKKQLASHLNVHPETISKLLRNIGIQGKRLLTPKELELAFSTVLNPIYFRVTRKKLAEKYHLHPETFSLKLKNDFGIEHQKKLSVNDIKLIYSKYGVPELLEESRIKTDPTPRK